MLTSASINNETKRALLEEEVVLLHAIMECKSTKQSAGVAPRMLLAGTIGEGVFAALSVSCF